MRRILLAWTFFLLAIFARAGEPVTLRFAVWDGDEGLRVLRAVLAKFEKQHPGIKVKLENVPYGMFAQKLLAQFAANSAPDVAMMEPPVFQRFAKRGVFLPLEKFFSDTPSFRIDDYYLPIRKALTYQGSLYVLPRDIAPIGLIYYNKRMFDEAGIKYPDGDWTWDFEPRPELKEKDFLWVMQQLSKTGPNGKPTQWGFVPAWTGAWADTVVYSQGLRYADNDEAPRKLLFDNPQLVKSMQWIADLSTKKGWMPSPDQITSVLQSSSTQLFLQQKVAMFQCGIWEVANVRKALKPGSKEFFEWDIALVPGHVDPATGKTIRAMPTGGSGYGVVSSSAHPHEAWLLTQFMAGEPGMQAMAAAGLAQPAIQRLAVTQPWIPAANAPKAEQYPASRILTDTAVQYVVYNPTADYFPEMKSLIDSKLEIVFNGSRDAKSAIEEGQANANTRLSEILKQETLPPINWSYGLIGGLLLLAAIVGAVYWPERHIRQTSREKKENRVAYSFLAPWLIGILVFTLGPMLLSLIMGFTDWDIITPARWRGTGNYGEAFFSDPRFWKALRVTGVYTLFAVPIGLFVSLMLAMLLNTKVKGIALFRTCFYLPSLASAVASALIWRKIFQPDGGLLNAMIYGPHGDWNLFGLGSFLSGVSGTKGPANWLGSEQLALPAFGIMSLSGAGGGMIILLAGLQAIPGHYYEAATIDGAGPVRKFFKVTLPLITPSLFFSLITGVIGSSQTFTSAFVMTSGGPNDSTRFYILHLYDQAFTNLRMGYASALAWIFFAIILVVTALQFRLNRLVFYEAETK